jgi:hypothetical protein
MKALNKNIPQKILKSRRRGSRKIERKKKYLRIKCSGTNDQKNRNSLSVKGFKIASVKLGIKNFS